VLTAANFFPVGEAMSRLREADELVEEPGLKLGWGPARYYRLRQCGAVVGFIGAMTNLHFCDQCNKMRLTADGRLRPCLGNHGELDLRSAVRGEGGDDAVRAVFQAGLTLKPPEHSFRGQYQPSRPMTAIGG
jgi:cyclic pyranopterin phosphate synthase